MPSVSKSRLLRTKIPVTKEKVLGEGGFYAKSEQQMMIYSASGSGELVPPAVQPTGPVLRGTPYSV